MWTLIYVDYADDSEHYERFEDLDELRDFIYKHNLIDNEDVLIFKPDTEVSIWEFLA